MALQERRFRRHRTARMITIATGAVALVAALSGCQAPFVGVASAGEPSHPNHAVAPTTRPAPTTAPRRRHRPGDGGQPDTTATATPPTGAPPPNDPPAPNPNCTLAVPAAPLTAAGLATPYRLGASGRGACHEANPDQSAFVEATILDPATGALSIYRPLVVDERTQPAAPPVVPTLPAHAMVGIWFGFQGDTLTLRGGTGCVNGLPGSPFGQFGYCNAPAFFAAANAAEKAKKITVPPLGTAVDGRPCPTTRHFSVVDQDQSDNLTTRYVALPDGRTAQSTPTTTALPGATTLKNASDNGLLVGFLDPALGCHPFTAPDQTSGAQATSLALNELQAAAFQGAPVATVPPNDPMALVGDRPSVAKTNLYRAGVNMAPQNPAVDTGAAYCTSLATVAAARLALDKQWTAAAPSPDPAAADSLFGFLTGRLTASWGDLGCQDLVHRGPPQVAGATGQGDPMVPPTTDPAPAPVTTTPAAVTPTTPTTPAAIPATGTAQQ